MKAETVLEIPARAQMRQGNPGVLRVPDDWRNAAKTKNHQQQIQPRPLQFPPEPAGQRQHEKDGNQLQRVGVFRKEPEPDQQAGKRRVPGKMRRFFQRQPESEHCRQPEKDRQRVDGHQNGANVKNWRRVQGDHRPKRRWRAEQAARKIKQKQTGGRRQQRTEEPHAKLAGAKERGAAPDGKGNTRSLAEVGRSEPLRPHPVMRLIEGEIAGAQQRQPNRR